MVHFSFAKEIRIFPSGVFVMSASIEPILESESGIEVVIRTDQNQGVEVQHLRSYGVGIDCHSKFIAICVHVRNNHKILRYSCEADTDWNSLVLATTADLITAYLSCSLGSIKGLGRKFFVTLQDFVSNQNKYKSLYQKLSPSAVPVDMTIPYS